MNTTYARPTLLTLLAFALLIACGHGGGGGGGSTTSGLVDKAMLTNVAANVAVPTYQAIVTQMGALTEALQALKAAPTDQTLAAAQQAWRTARVPWEQSEGLKFGPERVGSFDFEHLLDSPASESDITAIIDGTVTIDADTIKSNQDASGFHSIEFVLFGADGTKAAAALKPRELDYLLAATGDAAAKVATLLDAWQTSFNGGASYSLTFETAGDPSNGLYPSLASAGAEFVDALAVNSNELFSNKLGTPFRDQKSDEVESRYSNNSLADDTDSLRGMQAIYHGAAVGQTATPDASLKEHVVAAQPAVDQQIEADFTACFAALAAIPAPYSKSVTDPAAASAINAAITAISTLTADFGGQLQPLVVGQ